MMSYNSTGHFTNVNNPDERKLPIIINDGNESYEPLLSSNSGINTNLNTGINLNQQRMGREDVPPPSFEYSQNNFKQKRSLVSKLSFVLLTTLALLLVLCISLVYSKSSLSFLTTTYTGSDDKSAYGAVPTLEIGGESGGVATEHSTCSTIGKQMLEQGGSAVDAAIAGALCVGVVNGFSSGIGGGGFMLIRSPAGAYEFIDFREVAPNNTVLEPYLKQPNNTQFGGLAVGVPGELRGFELAHQKYGKLPWSKLFEPSIKLARNGFQTGVVLAHYIESEAQYILESKPMREVYTVEGRLATQGDIIYRKNLADTLQVIARDGADAFYRGAIAQQSIVTLKAQGSVMTMQDLNNYQPILRKPLVSNYQNRKLVTSPAPTSGAVLISILNVLSGYTKENLSFYERALELHRFVESFKFGYAQRTQLADPKFSDLTHTVNNIIDPVTAYQIRLNITDDTTHNYTYYNPKFATKDLPGTTHVSAISDDGMAVALTSTINLIFGSKVMDPKTGILFNNQMDDFAIPHTKNGFDLFPSPANFIQPNKRPLSSTVPTIIETKSTTGAVELLVLGGSGGSRITTSVAQVIHNFYNQDNGNVNDAQLQNLKRAMDLPRFHHQLLPDIVYLEKSFDKGLADSLRRRNHQVEWLDTPNSVVQVVYKSFEGLIKAASDGRKHGVAAAY